MADEVKPPPFFIAVHGGAGYHAPSTHTDLQLLLGHACRRAADVFQDRQRAVGGATSDQFLGEPYVDWTLIHSDSRLGSPLLEAVVAAMSLLEVYHVYFQITLSLLCHPVAEF